MEGKLFKVEHGFFTDLQPGQSASWPYSRRKRPERTSILYKKRTSEQVLETEP